MSRLMRTIDYADRKSWAYKFRRKRFDFFEQYFAKEISSKKPLNNCKYKILDVGGTEKFWNTMKFSQQHNSEIFLLNLNNVDLKNKKLKSVVGNATDMSEFENKSFDLVFSNSVIEHVGDYCRQMMMAKEVERIGKHIFIQTPNKYFFMEPHFLFPYFQLLPNKIKIFLLTHLSLGWMPKAKTIEEANKMADSIRLLSKKEFKKLFSEAKIKKERILGLTKSFIIYS